MQWLKDQAVATAAVALLAIISVIDYFRDEKDWGNS